MCAVLGRKPAIDFIQLNKEKLKIQQEMVKQKLAHKQVSMVKPPATPKKAPVPALLSPVSVRKPAVLLSTVKSPTILLNPTIEHKKKPVEVSRPFLVGMKKVQPGPIKSSFENLKPPTIRPPVPKRNPIDSVPRVPPKTITVKPAIPSAKLAPTPKPALAKVNAASVKEVPAIHGKTASVRATKPPIAVKPIPSKPVPQLPVKKPSTIPAKPLKTATIMKAAPSDGSAREPPISVPVKPGMRTGNVVNISIRNMNIRVAPSNRSTAVPSTVVSSRRANNPEDGEAKYDDGMNTLEVLQKALSRL
jgi:hypothetical protein